MKISKLFLWVIIFNAINGIAFGQSNAANVKEDRQYLYEIMRQTWTYLDSHLAKETGFPTDTQKPGGKTNTTNIGLYLASIGPACELGFISRADAIQRIRKIITSVQRIESRRGFLHNWLDVGGDTKMPDGVLGVSDFNKLVTGLILVRQFFPEVQDQATPLIERVEWGRLYDPVSGGTHWGYDAKNDTPIGLGSFWLASDCRLVVFYMIASGAAPPELWDRTNRKKVCADGLEFYEPGYWFGGLFMAAMDAMFLNELATEMGHSIADLTWHQIRQARRRGLEVWGWSNCNIPGSGYTEGGFLPWWVVTPHASALVIEYYPRHVIANLRKLESMGLREPLTAGAPAYGFRDSVDLRDGKVDDRYLCLDQAMIFLSLANFLEDATLRRHFAADPLVKRGLELLGPRLAQDPNLLEEWAKRDASEPKQIFTSPGPTEDVVLDFTKPEGISLSTNAGGQGKINAELTPKGLVIDFDLGPKGADEVEARIQFPQMDARNFKDIKIKCSAQSQGDLGGVRLYLFDDQGQQQYAYLTGIQSEMQELIVSESSRFGILARPHAVNCLAIKLWGSPWYYTGQNTKAKSGQLVIERIVFKRDLTTAQ